MIHPPTSAPATPSKTSPRKPLPPPMILPVSQPATKPTRIHHRNARICFLLQWEQTYASRRRSDGLDEASLPGFVPEIENPELLWLPRERHTIFARPELVYNHLFALHTFFNQGALLCQKPFMTLPSSAVGRADTLLHSARASLASKHA